MSRQHRHSGGCQSGLDPIEGLTRTGYNPRRAPSGESGRTDGNTSPARSPGWVERDLCRGKTGVWAISAKRHKRAQRRVQRAGFHGEGIPETSQGLIEIVWMKRNRLRREKTHGQAAVQPPLPGHDCRAQPLGQSSPPYRGFSPTANRSVSDPPMVAEVRTVTNPLGRIHHPSAESPGFHHTTLFSITPF